MFFSGVDPVTDIFGGFFFLAFFILSEAADALLASVALAAAWLALSLSISFASGLFDMDLLLVGENARFMMCPVVWCLRMDLPVSGFHPGMRLAVWF
jgi:hypothetical protein